MTPKTWTAEEVRQLLRACELADQLQLTLSIKSWRNDYTYFSEKWDHTEHRFTTEVYADSLAELVEKAEALCLTSSRSYRRTTSTASACRRMSGTG